MQHKIRINIKKFVLLMLVMLLIIGTFPGCNNINQSLDIPTEDTGAIATESAVEPTDSTEASISTTEPDETDIEGNHYAEVQEQMGDMEVLDAEGRFYFENDIYRKDIFSIADLEQFRRDGIYFQECIDPPEMNEGSHYAIHTLTQDGHIEFENTTFSKEVTVLNNLIHAEFTYADTDTTVMLTQINPTYKNELPRLNYVLSPSPDVHNALVVFACLTEDAKEVLVPAYIDLETGKIHEFMYGGNLGDYMDLDLKHGFTGCAISANDNVVFRHAYGKWYYSSAEDECVYDLEEIVGTAISDSVLLENSVICWNEDGDIWRVDTIDVAVTQIFDDINLQFYRGIDEGGPCTFILYKDNADVLHVYDFLTETDTLLTDTGEWEIFGGLCQPSPDGRKFMIGKKDGNGYQFGIFNCDTNMFTSFAREGAVTEDVLEWVRDDQVMILSSATKELYLYTVK